MRESVRFDVVKAIKIFQLVDNVEIEILLPSVESESLGRRCLPAYKTTFFRSICFD